MQCNATKQEEAAKIILMHPKYKIILVSSNDRAERHDFLPRLWSFFFPFLFPPFCSIYQIFQYCDRSIRFSIALWKSIDLNLFASTFKLFLCFFSLLLSLQFSILCIHVQLGENCSFYIIWKSNNFMVSKSEGLYIDMSIADK